MLQSTDSRHIGFRSCGSQAQLLHSLWNFPGAGIEPVSTSGGIFREQGLNLCPLWVDSYPLHNQRSPARDSF